MDFRKPSVVWGFALFSLGVGVVAVVSYLRWDLPLTQFLYYGLEGTNARGLFRRLAFLGESHWYLVPAFGLFALCRKTRPQLAAKAFYVFAAVGASSLTALALKCLFGRYRPKLFLREGLYGFGWFNMDSDYVSFPSGHAATALALAVALAIVLPRWRWFFYAFGVTIAFARLGGTSHYLSDVLVGGWLGVAGALAAANLMLCNEAEHAQAVGSRSPKTAVPGPRVAWHALLGLGQRSSIR